MMCNTKIYLDAPRDPSKGYYHTELGFNYRMTNIEAALGLAQMKQLDDFLTKTRAFHNIYREELKKVKGIRFQEKVKEAESSCWLSCVIIEDERDISALQKRLGEQGIPSRRLFVPIVEFSPG